MNLDNEGQRKMLLSIFEVFNTPGKYLDEVYHLKQAIVQAKIIEQNKESLKEGRKNV